jgi:hypothetical protein
LFKHPIILIIAVLSIAATATAEAKPKHAHHKRDRVDHAVIVCNERGCSDRVRASGASAAHAEVPPVIDANGNGSVVGHRPAGCPHAFCGCEASRYLFGEIRPDLNLAANWIRKFPRTQPAPGMAAARSHHVMVLMSHVDGKDWLVHDGNSGGGLTREHVQSIRGYVIVDPHGSRSASR